MDLTTVLAAIQAVMALSADLPEFEALIAEVKTAFSATDQAAIDAAMNAANVAADEQHAKAQGLS